MNHLELNAYGVVEMNQQEMLNVEGGNVICAIAKVAKAIAGFVVAVADAIIGSCGCDK